MMCYYLIKYLISDTSPAVRDIFLPNRINYTSSFCVDVSCTLFSAMEILLQSVEAETGCLFIGLAGKKQELPGSIQDGSYLVGQNCRNQGFGYKMDSLFEYPLLRYDIVRVSGHEKDLHARLKRLKEIGKFLAVHFLHNHIG